MLDESGLHRMQLAVTSQAFDGSDFVALMHDREGEAGIDSTAVDVDGAGAALAMVTAFLSAEHLEVIAESIEQGDSRLEFETMFLAVDLQRNRNCAWNLGRGCMGWRRFRLGGRFCGEGVGAYPDQNHPSYLAYERPPGHSLRRFFIALGWSTFLGVYWWRERIALCHTCKLSSMASPTARMRVAHPGLRTIRVIRPLRFECGFDESRSGEGCIELGADSLRHQDA